MFRRNLTDKLLALTIALVIWFYASEGQNPVITREIKLPLQVRNLDPDCVVTAIPPSVKVVLEGNRSHIRALTSDPDAMSALVDLRGKTAGRRSVAVKLSLPEGLTGLVNWSANPREVPVTLEKKIERKLPIKAKMVGTARVGYRFGSPLISPDEGVVSGVAQHVNRVTHLELAIDATSATEDGIIGEFEVVALDKQGRQVPGVDVSPQRVALRIGMLEVPASRAVFVSIDVDGQPPFPYTVDRIEVKPQTVTLTGRPEQLEGVTAVNTEPIRLEDRTKTFIQQVKLIVPQGLTLANGGEVTATVHIRKLPDSTVIPG